MMNDEPFKSDDHDTAFGGINLLNAQLRSLDERGLILSLAAFAEDSLGTLLTAFMLPTEATKQLIEGFNAPLGTLSARSRAAYALGLVTRDQFEDLERLRKIRNAFSHSWKPISLNDPGIADHVRAINYSNVDDTFPATAIEKVRVALSFLLVELQATADQIAKKGRRVGVIETRLIAGIHAPFDEQLAACRNKFADLREQIPTATGEKQAFLRIVWSRWLDKLTLIENLAPRERRAEIVDLRRQMQEVP